MKRDPYEIRHLLPVAVPVPPPAHVATRDHVCGNCRQPGTNMGSTACRNYRPSQSVPYERDLFDSACVDRAGNRCMECDECHEYLVSRDLDARIDQMREERWFDELHDR